MAEIPIILLAAGGSFRMGKAKQLLPWGDKTLIEFQVEKLLEPGNPVYVVLGSSAKQISPLLKKYPVNLVLNPEWEQGIGTSVAAGIRQIISDLPNAKAVIYTLIDQPLVSTDHLKKIIETLVPGSNQIIASQSESGWLGVPALFDATYFSELKELSGESGAKVLITKYLSQVHVVDAGDSLVDMDTPQKYHRLKQNSRK